MSRDCGGVRHRGGLTLNKTLPGRTIIKRLVRKLERFEPVPPNERAFLKAAIARVAEYDPGEYS